MNPGFVELGRRLGKEKLFQYIDKFGFGRKTGIDLNGEGSGILFSLDRVGPVELATTAFGQGVSVTAIQQVVAVSAAVNGGILYQPFVVKRLIESDTNEIIQENNPKQIRRVISKTSSEKVRYALESVVALGSGRNAYIDGYRIGGKTGTAQKVNHGVYMVGNYITSFMGFFPADDPEVVLYVAIDYPKGITAYGGTVAAPIFRNIAEDVIATLNIEKRNNGLKKEYRYFDIKYISVPNVIGMNVKDARNYLKDFSVEYSGNGDRIIAMSPEAGSSIPINSTIRLMLE